MAVSFNEAFPVDHLKRTESALRDVWAGKTKTAFSTFLEEPAYRQLDDYDEMLRIACDRIPLEKDLPGLNIPRFMPDFGTTCMAAYWGGKRYRPEGGMPWIDPVIYSAEDVDKVAPDDPDSHDLQKSYVLWKKLSEMMGTDRLPCSYMDIQGPLGQAAMLWENTDFFAALYEEPAKVHSLLERITEHTIKMYKTFRKKIPTVCSPMWPYIWMPADIGVAISEDHMPLVSAETYKEFGLPYVERLSDELGGIFIHCCGKYGHQFENLKKSKANIVGLEFAFPHVDLDELFNCFGSSVLFVPQRSTQGGTIIPDKVDFLKYVISKRLKETRLWFILQSQEKDFGEQAEYIQSVM